MSGMGRGRGRGRGSAPAPPPLSNSSASLPPQQQSVDQFSDPTVPPAKKQKRASAASLNDEHSSFSGGTGPLAAAPAGPYAPEDRAQDEAAEVAKREKMMKLRKMVAVQDKGGDKPAKGDGNDDDAAMEDAVDEDESEEAAMARLMGFGGFETTKNKKVEDNHTGAAQGAAAVKKARKYRQYMNRKGGFNRPLEKLG